MSCVSGDVLDNSSDHQLPFTCPFNIPKGLPKPGEKDGGLAPNFNLDRVDKRVYGQYKAAEALVPCDGKAIQLFTTNDIQDKEYSVSAIYVFSRPIQQLEKWLKYVTKIFNNINRRDNFYIDVYNLLKQKNFISSS